MSLSAERGIALIEAALDESAEVKRALIGDAPHIHRVADHRGG
jgi:hypothetical protein